MSAKRNDFICSKCLRAFTTSRGLSLHTNHCTLDIHKLNENSLTLTSRSLHVNVKKRKKNDGIMHRDSDIHLSEPQSPDNFTVNTQDHQSSPCIDTNSTPHHSKQSTLLDQQRKYSTGKNQDLKHYQCLAEVDLLKLTSDLKCHNTAYDRIMNWASFWNSKNVFFNSSPLHSFYNRDVVIRRLSKQYDMEKMKPINRKVIIHENEHIKEMINVTYFPFEQQILSLLRDKELMDPKNLVLDYEPGEEPDFPKEMISEINHSDWFESAYNHYNVLHGPSKNRVICGIVFAIDKTHTDTKGKLCLESVNFTLALFNSETRRNNPKAWRSLGFINDLNAKYGSGIEQITDTMNTKSSNVRIRSFLH